MAEPFMTALEAVAWIMFRDENFAQKAKDMSLVQFSIAWAAKNSRPTRTRISAQRVLVSKCEDGRIVANAVPGLVRAMGPRRQIPAISFGDLRFGENKGQLTLQTKDGHIASEYFSNPRFRRADVLCAFPSSSVVTSSVDRNDSAVPIKSEQPKLQTRAQPKKAAAQEGLAAVQIELSKEGRRLRDLSHKEVFPRLEAWCHANDKPLPGNRVFRAVLAEMRHSS